MMVAQIKAEPKRPQSARADLLRRAKTYLKAYARLVGDDGGDISETVAALNDWIAEIEK